MLAAVEAAAAVSANSLSASWPRCWAACNCAMVGIVLVAVVGRLVVVVVVVRSFDSRVTFLSNGGETTNHGTSRKVFFGQNKSHRN